MSIKLRDVSKTHQGPSPVEAVRGVSLTAEPGEMIAITGRSGSGKTTLLNLVGGLELPTSGEVLIDGIDLSALSRKALAKLRRRSLGYVFQDLNLIPVLTAVENVALPLELDGITRKSAEETARDALIRVLPQSAQDRFPDQLSGGEQQRVAIARALCGDRSILLADEPTGALDDLSSESIMQLLVDRAREGATVMVVTHDAGLASWADRIIHLADGQIAAETVREAVST